MDVMRGPFLFFFNALACVHRQPFSDLLISRAGLFVVRARVYSGTFRGPYRPPKLICIAYATRVQVSGRHLGDFKPLGDRHKVSKWHWWGSNPCVYISPTPRSPPYPLGYRLLPTLTHGSKNWIQNVAQQSRLRAIEMSYLRGMYGASRCDGLSNESAYERYGMRCRGSGLGCGVMEWVKTFWRY